MAVVEGATNRMSDLADLIVGDSPEKGNTAVEDKTPDAGSSGEPDTPLDAADADAEAPVEGADVEDAPVADESEDADQTEQAKSEPELYTVVIDGKEEKVSLDEALKGYQRGKDYTQKAQAVAEVRKAAEAEQARYRDSRAQYEQILNLATQRINEAEPNLTNDQWAKLEAEDPVEYNRLIALKVRLRDQKEVIKAEQEKVGAEKQRELAAFQQRYLSEQAAMLLAKQPAWRDQKRYSEDFTALREYVQNTYGVSESEFNALHDHRVVLMANKARLYDDLMAKRNVVQKKVASAAPKAPVPAPRKPAVDASKAELAKAREKFNKSGRIDDALPLMFMR